MLVLRDDEVIIAAFLELGVGIKQGDQMAYDIYQNFGGNLSYDRFMERHSKLIDILFTDIGV